MNTIETMSCLEMYAITGLSLYSEYLMISNLFYQKPFASIKLNSIFCVVVPTATLCLLGNTLPAPKLCYFPAFKKNQERIIEFYIIC